MANTIERISIDTTGVEGNDASYTPSLSADGRYVAFVSWADNLVAGDNNGKGDIFVHDRATGTTTRVSVSSSGTEANQHSSSPGISADGRFVTFWSDANNLVSGDTNGTWDVFVHDRQTGVTERVSVDSAGVQGNQGSYTPEISADGRYVTFESDATNLGTGADTNGQRDSFVHDRTTGVTTRVSVDGSGAEGNSKSWIPVISGNGRFVTFTSNASNLVTGDTNNTTDVFVRDLQTGVTTRASVDSSGTGGTSGSYDSVLSYNGRFVAYESLSSNLVSGDTNGVRDIFLHDNQTGETTRISVSSGGAESNGSSDRPAISADGRFISFHSSASNLVGGDTNGRDDIFVHDRLAGTTERISVNGAGVEGSGNSSFPAISADGKFIAFGSSSNNLVASDTNGSSDVFVAAHTFPRFTNGNDVVALNDSGETVDALGGDDSVTGGDGADNINVGAGADVLVGGLGNDTLDGGSSDPAEIDVLYGGVGDDTYIVNSTSAALDIVNEDGAFAGGASDVDTIVSMGEFFWDFYNVGEVLTIDAAAGEDAVFVSGNGDSTMNGSAESNILLAYGGSNEINPGKGIDTIGLSLYGLDASFNGVNTVRLNAGDDVNYMYDFESGIDKIDTSAYGRFADGAQMLANVLDVDWGCFVWMGAHEGQNEYVAFVDMFKADLDAGDFLV